MSKPEYTRNEIEFMEPEMSANTEAIAKRAGTAIAALRSGRYAEAIAAFEAVEDAAYLGVAHLLSGDEATAQLLWMAPLMEAQAEDEAAAWSRRLTDVLETEARVQSPKAAWLLRQHLRDIDPENVENQLHLAQLCQTLDLWMDGDDLLAQLGEWLQSASPEDIPRSLLLETCERLLPALPQAAGSLAFWAAAFPWLREDKETGDRWIDRLVKHAKTLEQAGRHDDALELGQFCLAIAPQHFQALLETARFLQHDGQNLDSIALLDRALAAADTLPQKILASHIQLRGLLRSGGQWQRAEAVCSNHRRYLEAILDDDSDLSLEFASRIITAGGMTTYFRDDLPSYRRLRNAIAATCQTQLQRELGDRLRQFARIPQPREMLKIGYLSECFRRHSVGWLVRWLLQHHDRRQFEIHLYSLHHTGDELQQTFAAAEAPNFHELPYSAIAVADKIHADGIDILVDLDSITSNCGCSALALKPAPVQVSWLGSDAPGLPSVDYFLSDPYVLTDAAQSHYCETLWQLPQTYIAVDGFEFGVPSLHRRDLDIPAEAIVYFSSQTGYKRNPTDARRQLQILKQVPNSYFLIKGLHTNVETVREAFEALAEAEGVARDRLRFLPTAPSEMVHRANLRIADVVLDTYPYNGTTTTLETLWAGIPVVSRVGEQFASRQGYTLLKNAGVEAGIAFTDEEYVDWGVRLGTDAELRRQVSQQLLLNRRTAPLWNARQFAREVEAAYRQMWERAVAAGR